MSDDKSQAAERKLDYYTDSDDEWRWTLRDARNGTIVGSATQGYNDLRDARHNVVATLEDGEQLDAAAIEEGLVLSKTLRVNPLEFTRSRTTTGEVLNRYFEQAAREVNDTMTARGLARVASLQVEVTVSAIVVPRED